MYCCPWMVYGTNVRTGAAVSYWPCDACQICSVVPRSACLNGYGIDRSADDHSSFDRPAMTRLPFTYCISVIVCVRGFCRAAVFDAGASERLTVVCLTLSSGTTLS